MAARWLLTAVLIAAAVCAGPVRRPGRPAAAFCVLMCSAMIVMVWRIEPAVVTWVQVAGFGGAALWFVLARRIGSGRFGRPVPADVHHALMAAAMIWMLTALSAGTQMRSTMPGHSEMAGMSAAIPWLGRAVGPGARVTDLAAAGQAMMSAGMAAMLIAMVS